MLLRTCFPVILACGGFFVGTMTPSHAHACSQPGPEEIYEPCVSLMVTTPAVTFPLNVVDEIYLEHMDRDGYGDHSPAATEFPAPDAIEVVRATPDGYEPLQFELLPDSEAGDHVRFLSVLDPQPGHYVITWQGETCFTSESPTGSGVAIREFDVTDAISVPASLGTLTAKPSTLVVDEYQASDEGECYPESEGTTVTATAPVSLNLEPDVVPWAEVVELAVRVDGEPHPNITRLAARDIETGVVNFDLKYVCSTDRQAGVGPQSMTQGSHTITVHGKFGDTELETAPVAITLSCEGAEEALEEAQDDDGGGCSVATLGSGSRSHAPWAFVAAAAMVVAYRRRRSSRG